MTDGDRKDEFHELEKMIRRILESTLRGQDGMLPPGFHIIVSGGEIPVRSGSVPIQPSRMVEEPETEICDVGEGVTILVDVPGASLETTHLQVTGRVLRIYADGGERRYKTVVELPPVNVDSMVSRITHGVLEITFSRESL